MEIRPHTNATTTPKQWAYIQQSVRPATEPVVGLKVSETTIRRWRVRKRPKTGRHATSAGAVPLLQSVSEETLPNLSKTPWLTLLNGFPAG